MESAPDLLHLFVKALALVAMSLDRWFPVPWAVPIAVLFVPFVAAMDGTVWYLRGMTFPISCGYPRERGGLCTRLTLGEWHKCWYHSKFRLRKTDQHLVDPNRRRWETQLQTKRGTETIAVRGHGFLSFRSHRDTLLYHQGFARPCMDVLKKVPEVVYDYRQRAIDRWTGLKALGIRGLFPVTDEGKRQIATSNVLPAVIHATRLVLGVVFIGLVLTLTSLAVPTWLSAICEYCATYLLILALAVAKAGILDPDERWLSRSLTSAGKWIISLTALATLGGLIGLYAHDVVDVLRTAVETAFSAFTLLVVGYLIYLFASKPEKKRTARRRPRRK